MWSHAWVIGVVYKKTSGDQEHGRVDSVESCMLVTSAIGISNRIIPPYSGAEINLNHDSRLHVEVDRPRN